MDLQNAERLPVILAHNVLNEKLNRNELNH